MGRREEGRRGGEREVDKVDVTSLHRHVLSFCGEEGRGGGEEGGGEGGGGEIKFSPQIICMMFMSVCLSLFFCVCLSLYLSV